MSVAPPATSGQPAAVRRAAIARLVRRNGWILGLWCPARRAPAFTRSSSSPTTAHRRSRSLAIAALPLAPSRRLAQTIVVIAGGIDLSVGSMMALTNVTAAVLMKGGGEEFAVVAVIVILLMGLVLGSRQRRARGAHAGARHRGDARDVASSGRARRCSSSTRPGGSAAELAQAHLGRRRDARPASGSPRPWCCSSWSWARLDPAAPIAPGPVHLRRRQRPARGASAAASTSTAPRSPPTR